MHLMKAKNGDVVKIKNRPPIKIIKVGNGLLHYTQKRKKGIMVFNIFTNKYYDSLSDGETKIISPIVKKMEMVK